MYDHFCVYTWHWRFVSRIPSMESVAAVSGGNFGCIFCRICTETERATHVIVDVRTSVIGKEVHLQDSGDVSNYVFGALHAQ